MASTCDACGYRNSEVGGNFACVIFLSPLSLCLLTMLTLQLKPGGPIPEKGKKITLSVKNIDDLSRDVIKVFSGHELNIILSRCIAIMTSVSTKYAFCCYSGVRQHKLTPYSCTIFFFLQLDLFVLFFLGLIFLLNPQKVFSE